MSSLAQLKKPSAIIGNQLLFNELKKLQSGEGARFIPIAEVTKEKFPTPLAGPYFVVTEDDELATKQKLRDLLWQRGISPDIYGALHELIPMVLAGSSNPEKKWGEPLIESLYGNRGVVITCTPRSGSQFLARKFEEYGIGAPKEHVRPGVINLIKTRTGKFQFIPWFISLAHHASRNGIFATKLISHFIRDLENFLHPVEWAVLRDFISQSALVYLLRSDKLSQALSRDRAKATQHYHLFDESKRADYQKSSDSWDYDFDRIFREILKLEEEEKYIFDLMTEIRPQHDFYFIEYESMDISDVMSNMIARLNLCPPKVSRQLPTQILRDEQTVEFYLRFKKEYQRKFSAQDVTTHAPLRVTYNRKSGQLDFNHHPDDY